MEAKRKISPFAETTHVSPGDVRMSEIAIEQSTGELNELLPGQWSLGQRESVLYDQSSRRLLVDTWDKYLTLASRLTFNESPAIARVGAESNGVARLGYVANLSYIRSHHHRMINLGLDDMSIDDAQLHRRAETYGTQLLGGVVLREFGRLRYEGEPEYEEGAALFTEQLDEFYAGLPMDNTLKPIPGIARFEPSNHPAASFEISTHQADHSTISPTAD